MARTKRQQGARNRRSRPRLRARATRALAAGAAIAAGTQAYAAPVRFDNPPPGEPNHFDWPAAIGSFQYFHSLYIQLPPEDQGTAMYWDWYGFPQPGPRSFMRTQERQGYYGNWYDAWIRAGWFASNAGIQTAGNFWGAFAGAVESGDPIPAPGLDWNQSGEFGDESWGKVRNATSGESLIPEGIPAYLGARIQNLDGGAGFHYGWIGVIRDGGDLQAFAWGYETDVGVPIAAGIPEPGTLAMLAFGAALVASRRR
jgi:hypothetical protein